MATEEKPSQETPDQVIEEISNRNDIPATYEPPSPLTGCYLLIILGEPHSQEHKDIILQRLLKGLLSWNVLDCHVDLEEELNNLTNHAPEGEAARHGERLIQFASENLVTEILIHPQYNTLIQCMRNLLSSFTRHRHIIHSGYTFSGNGSWILQDATFSVSDFAEALQDYEVQRVMRAYPDTISMEIHCATSGHWNKLPDKSFAKLCKIRINSVDILDSGSERLNAFINYLSPLIAPANLNELMASSDVVGNIRFSHPTLYVFPGGQGDAALFGINGFNMLVDGGFNRKSCFWDFTRHLDRLDAVLMTRISNANIQGLSSIIERKAISNVYPQLGYFFTNIPESKPEPSLESDKDSDPLLVNLFERGQSLTSNLKSINLKPQPCYKDVEPINLYHKVGHGTLDMYVISPSRESKEVKEFLHKWNARDQNLFATKQSKEFQFPLQNLVSICAMLVWQPANPEETITRILFPGSTPDYKIMEGLDKMKHLEFVKHPVCTANQIEATSFSSTILSKKQQLKSALADKSTHEQTILPSKVTRTVVAQEKDNKTVTETKTVIKTEKESAVVDGETTKVEAEKEQEKDNKTASESKPVVKSRIDSRPPKSMEKKLKKDSSTEKKSSPVTTPKKEAKQPKEKEREIKSRIISRVAKISPSSTPAKSTKEANNRKVFESKQRTSVKTVKKDVSQTISEKKETVKELKVERKAISRRPKPAAGSPMKSIKKSTAKDTAVIHKPKADKGAASDSSVVSTPSAATDDVKVKKTAVEQEKQILLDDLIEEQEAVREIEAVLQRSESKQIDDDERRTIIIDKQDSTTEADEDEEYIIIEKEEQYTEECSVNDPESGDLTGKEEVKHQRDSQESEKKRKPSIETTEEEEEPQQAGEKLTEQDKPDAESVAAAEEPIDVKEEEMEEAISTSHKMNGDVPKAKSDIQEEAKSDEGSPISDEKQPSDEKKTDVKEELAVDKIPADTKEADIVNVPESQATAESGATTAPTLPEDEHIPLDEVKENVVIEEKYIKEETKETQVVVTTVDEPVERVQPKPMQFDAQQPHLRELNIKTPDEVADLPVHEEADIATDETPAGSRKASLRKGEELAKQEQPIKTEPVEIESKDIDDAKVSPKEENLGSKTPIEKKSPSPTSVEPKVASPVEKVEYKVEDLGKQFESTLKDVTAKVEFTDEPNDLKGKSPVDDSKPNDTEAPSPSKEEILIKDEADDRKSVSPIDVKQEEIRTTLIQTENTEIKTEFVAETIEELTSVSPDKIESERKASVVDKTSDVKAEKIASKSASPDLKEEISATPKEVETVSGSKRESLIEDDDFKAEIAKVSEPKPIEIATSKSPSPTRDEKIGESPKPSEVTNEKLASVSKEPELKKAELELEEPEQIISKAEVDIATAKAGDVVVSEEIKSASPIQDIIETKEEKVASKSPSPDLKEQASVSPVSPVPQKEVVVEIVASVDSKRASLKDDTAIEAAKPNEPEIEEKEKSKSPSPTKDEPIIESREQSVAEIERKTASPVEKEHVVSPPKSVSPPAKDDIASPERKDSAVATKSITPTELNLQSSDYTEVYDYSHPFDAQCPNELRETHITTVESPIVEKSKLIDLQVIDKTITEIIGGDDSSLNDIREEDEEDRVTPPREEIQESSPKPSVPLEVHAEPPRSVSPREQEVLKIVANVAEVLKSEKDITDIIPDFNEDELEKNIMQRASTPEVFSSIKESADFHDLSASLSEAKTSTNSIDEKEQHEIAEKHQAGFQKEVADGDVYRKESYAGEVLDDSRRESAISTFSERDFTKDESTLDKFSRSNSSLELKHDELEVKSTEIETHSEVTQIEKSQVSETVAIDSRRQSLLSDKPGSTSPEKQEELEQSKTVKPTAEETKVLTDRKESISLKLEEDSATVQRMLVTASSEDGGEETEICAEGTIKFSPSATTPETFSGKATPEIDHDDLQKKPESGKETVEASHIESTLEVDDLTRRETTSRQSDRPDSVMSHFSDTTEPELKETCSSPEKQVHEKQSSSSGKSTGSPSTASSSHGSVEIEKKDESRPESRDIGGKIEEKHDLSGKTTSTDANRPESAADDKNIDDVQAKKSSSLPIESDKKDTIEKEDDKQLSTSDLSRPESAAKPESRSQSVASEEKVEIVDAQQSRSQSIVIEKQDDSGKTAPAEVSHPESAASDRKAKTEVKSPSPPPEKESSRPVSSASVEKIEHASPTPSTKSTEEKADDDKSPEDIQKSHSQSIASEKVDISGKTTPLPVSRPESAASNISAKDAVITKTTADLIEPISCDEQKSHSPSLKEELIEEESTSSKIDSVASAIDVQKDTEKSPVKDEATTKTITTIKSEVKDECTVSSTFVEQIVKSPSPPSEAIKKDSLDKADDQSVLKGDVSRPGSVASDISSKDGQKSPVVSTEKEQITTKSESRSQSIVSVISEEKEEDEKSTKIASPSPPESVKRDSFEKVDDKKSSVSETSRPESAASDISSKDQAPSPNRPTKEESSATKVESRSQSVGSVEKVEIVEAHQTRSQSIVSEKQEASGKTTPAEVSRPESAASDRKAETEVKSPSPPQEKESSRPVSSACVEKIEHASPTPSTKSTEEKADDDKSPEDIQKSRSQSIASEKVDISGKTTPLPVSRPESAASNISAKDAEITKTTADLIEPISCDEKAKQKDQQVGKLSSPPTGAIKRESLQKADGDSVSKGDILRPESVANDISSKDQPPSLALPTKEESSATKVESRSESVTSVVSEEKVEIVDAQQSRSQSIVSEKQDASGKTAPAEVSRPESAASDRKAETEVKSPSPPQEKESSRPVSSASVEKIEHASPTPSTKSTEEKADDDKSPEDIQKSRSQSIASEKVDISGKTTPLPVSRPESAASNISAKDAVITKTTADLIEPISCDEQKSHSPSLKEELIEEESTASKIDSIASAIDVQKDTEKSPVKDEATTTTITTIKSEVKDECTVSSTFVEQIVKSPSPPSEAIKKDSFDKADDQSVLKGDVSRPGSVASDISSKDGQKSPVVSTEKEQITTKSESRSQSIVSVISEEKEEDEKSTKIASPSPLESVKRDSFEKVDDKKLSVSESSRPESATSDISSKDQAPSPNRPTKDEPSVNKVESRSQSVASEEKVEIVDAQQSRSQSIVSEKQEASGKTTPAEGSRPESAASDGKKSDSKITDSQIQSTASVVVEEKTTSLAYESCQLTSDIAAKAEKPKNETESSDLDGIGVQIATGSTICDIHDSADKKTGDKGIVDDKFVIHDLPKKTDVMKESRSKSVASISVFGTGKTPQSFDLEKITELSKDDSNLAGSSRKASDISTLIEDVKKIDEKISKPTASEKVESTEVTTTTSTKDEHLSSLDHKLGQQKSAHSSLESTTSDKVSIETVLDSGVLGSFDTKEHSFDLPATTTKEVTSSVQVVTKEISAIKSDSKTLRDSDNESLPISDDEAVTSSQKYSYEDYQFERSNSELSKKSDLDIDDSQNDIPPEYKSAVGYGSQEFKSAVTVSSSYTMDPMMSASFYGELPSGIEKSEPSTTVTTVRTVTTKQFDVHGEGDPITHTHTIQETSTTKSDDHKFLDEADMGFEKALEEHRQARGDDVMSSITSKYEFSPSKFPADKLTETASGFPLSDVKSPKEQSKDDAASSADALAKQLEDDLKKAEERVASWGKPLGLPVSIPENPSTPKKERKIASAKIKLNNEKNIQKRASSPNKSKKSTPIYMDLTYVPHNGNSYYSHVEFFKRVRARYYVFSGTEPSRDVYNALLEAKQTWEDKSLEVTIIPTYDTDVLGYWVAENEEMLAKYHIDLSPSASRCTINLQDHETCCSAYRLEF